MAVSKKCIVPYLMLIDPEALLPAMLLLDISASPLLTLDERLGLVPAAALLVVGVDELPSRAIMHYREVLKDVPLVIYDPAPTVGRQANTFNAAAGGYIIEGTTVADLLPVIELARIGGFGLCRQAFERVLSGLHAPVGFSPREREVVTLMALGATNAMIGGELHMSEKEVDTCIQRACHKVGVDSNTALATWWTHWTLNDDFVEEEETSGEVSFAISA